ncbi:hypothetical protein GCM10010372_06890 [Streptomyces tauricus]|uniref:Integral membrane protein n=1 Tax=Streptomyces tauricus TaxID=68274 RepID=A0ABZ1JCN1_9ACTN|nr:hypothetical protein [Streptomyces tauricus]MCW8098181.1 hypothetical protein [Streptomyces tauricus]GHA09820.1 hypothetical protein GCM10010372_06890 [Streptomyces tauricus]
MTTWDGDGPSVFFARVPGASWPDDESDCRWCSILLGPGFATGPARTAREPVRRRPGHRTGRVRAWLERTRTVMLPVAAITVLAALTLVAMG